jgi:fatty-acyl-CoA synthase
VKDTDDVGPVHHAPLTPVDHLLRSAAVWGGQTAVRHGGTSVTYREFLSRTERTAGHLAALGVRPGDRVAVLLRNVPAMLEAHFAVPGLGAALVPLNTRLTPGDYAYVLGHARPVCLLTETAFAATAERAVAGLDDPPRVLFTDTPAFGRELAAAEARPLLRPEETTLLSVNYTSGTTGRPKGAMYTHRGAYLHALGVIAEAGLGPGSRYLWTLPMFHCNGWAFTWAVTATGGRHVCLEQLAPAVVWRLLREEGITHLCASPTVLTMLARAPEAAPLERPVRVFAGGAPPSPALLARVHELGMEVTHLYGLTETYGPIAVCAWQPGWDALPAAEQERRRARQGVATLVSRHLRVVDADMADVPADGRTMGEVVMRGNNVMTGYYRDPAATAAAFAGGWFHSGDLAVMHPDGYVELRDRLKDIVVSGGENISTIEVEQALAAHPDVEEVAVVGVADDHWGETPKAFVVLRDGAPADADALRAHARERLAAFKVPRHFAFRADLPRTSTGKIQKYLLRGADPTSPVLGGAAPRPAGRTAEPPVHPG